MAKQKKLYTPKTATCTHNIFNFVWNDACNTNPMEDHQHHCHHHYHQSYCCCYFGISLYSGTDCVYYAKFVGDTIYTILQSSCC